jgi:hypothetical protein
MFDIIGTIYKETGVTLTDAEGNEYPEMKEVEGFFVNTLPEFMSEELKPFIVTPTALHRVFAGRDDTVCLKFNSEAEFKALVPEEV